MSDNHKPWCSERARRENGCCCEPHLPEKEPEKQLPFSYHPWKPPFKYDRDGTMILDADGNMIVDVRGWGFLTGQGALALPEDEAIKIQDAIGNRICLLLNRDAELNSALNLLQAGNAAVNQNGTIVDKRENPEAIPVLPHESREAAVQRAELMRAQKIKSLQKQLAKLEQLHFA